MKSSLACAVSPAQLLSLHSPPHTRSLTCLSFHCRNQEYLTSPLNSFHGEWGCTLESSDRVALLEYYYYWIFWVIKHGKNREVTGGSNAQLIFRNFPLQSGWCLHVFSTVLRPLSSPCLLWRVRVRSVECYHNGQTYASVLSLSYGGVRVRRSPEGSLRNHKGTCSRGC